MPGCAGKVIPGTRFMVDEFKQPLHENCVFLLSHFHSDHYAGITKNWSHGVIYCSKVTAQLVHLVLEVKQDFVHPLELNVMHEIDGHHVTLVDANHCPGAVLFVITPQGGEFASWIDKQIQIEQEVNLHQLLVNAAEYCHVHTGDFRAQPSHWMHPALQDKRVNTVYLDTTANSVQSGRCLRTPDLH
eukprot:m.1083031 g.1083031  ORF g.1083031 m.1083031 type:complete len:187 (-) comp24268_c1_seq5:4211-4771(-)